MNKKILKFIFLVFCTLSAHIRTESSEQIFIVAKINDVIITNYDLEKEKKYLKILNPDLSKLNNNDFNRIAKKSLFNEIIKFKEIEKYIDLKSTNIDVDKYLANIYYKFDVQNKQELLDKLENNNSYSLDEIKEKIKFELLWNDLIYSKYSNQVLIDKEKLLKKINQYNNEFQKEYFITEIVFQKNDQPLKDLIKKIYLSIQDIGFNNTANIFSISESSKNGGKIGWIRETALSDDILKKIANLEEGQYSDIINIGNNFIILKIEKIRKSEILRNEENELKNLIKIETEKQLSKFSKIFFDKVKANYLIDEK